MSYTTAANNNAIEQWMAEKLNVEKLRAHLTASGCDEETINTTLQAFKKALYAKQQFKGFIFLGIGAFTGFLSCVTSLINPVPELFYWFLYGLTSVALLLIFLGLYFLFS